MTATSVETLDAFVAGVGLDSLVRASFARRPPRGLISQMSTERILAVASCLPAFATSFFGYECRLGRDRGQADFLLRITPSAGELAALAPFWAEMRGTHAAWARLSRFFEDIATAQGRRRTRLDSIWLEFDLGGTDRVMPPPIPSLFLGPKPSASRSESTDDLDWLLDAAADLWGSSIDPEWARTAARTVEHRPEGSRLFQFGMMMSRPAPYFRLCLEGVPAASVASYLERIGWPGNVGAVDELLTELGPQTSQFALGLDSADRLGPRLGIECYAGHDEGTAQRSLAIQGVLSRRGLATANEIQAINEWGAALHQQILRACWPAEMNHHPSRPGPSHRGLLVRVVNHVKFSVEGSSLLPAKVYLRAQIHWLDDDEMLRIVSRVNARQPSSQ